MSVRPLGYLIDDVDTGELRIEWDGEYVNLWQDEDHVQFSREHAREAAETILKLLDETVDILK